MRVNRSTLEKLPDSGGNLGRYSTLPTVRANFTPLLMLEHNSSGRFLQWERPLAILRTYVIPDHDGCEHKGDIANYAKLELELC